MSVKYAPSKLRVPNGFQYLLEALAREILREQPENIIQFADKYFKQKLQQRAECSTGKDVPKKSSEVEITTEDVPPASTSEQGTSNEEEIAAIKIQSIVRGAKARKEVQALKASSSTNVYECDGTTEQTVEDGVDAVHNESSDAVVKDPPSSNAPASDTETTVADISSSLPTTDIPPSGENPTEEELADLNAITKIQAVFRGQQARKEVDDLRKASGNAAVKNEQDLPASSNNEVSDSADANNTEVNDSGTELSTSDEAKNDTQNIAETDGNVEASTENETTDETATESKENDKTDESITETKTDAETTDIKTDTETTDIRTDTETTDIKTNAETTEIKTDVETSDTKTDVETTDTKTDVETTDTKTDVETTDTKTDVETTDTKTDVETTDTKTDVETTDNKTDVETTDTKTDVETTDTKTDVETTDTKTDVETTDNITDAETTDKKSDETDATDGASAS